MQWFLSGVLFVLGGILSVLLLMNTWSLIMLVFEQHQMGGNEILGSIVTWFLYFEFLALIAKYYQSGLHFPLRYFIYIGVTAIIRLIILYHDDPLLAVHPRPARRAVPGEHQAAETGRIEGARPGGRTIGRSDGRTIRRSGGRAAGRAGGRAIRRPPCAGIAPGRAPRGSRASASENEKAPANRGFQIRWSG